MNTVLSSNLIKNTLWSFFGRFGSLAITLITNIILVRLLSPKEFGQIAVIMFFIAVASVLVESGLSGALVRKKEVTEVDYSTVFVFNLVVAVVFIAVLVLSSEAIADFYEDEKLKNILIVSSFILLINSLRLTQATKMNRNLQFKQKAIYELIAVVFASVIAVILAINNAGVWSLIAFQLSISILMTFLLWFFIGPMKSFKFSPDSFKATYKFGINTTLASLLNSSFDNIYQLILAKYFSIVQAGYFYQAKKLQEIPSGIFITISSGVVYATLSKLQDSPKEFNKLYQNTLRVFTIIIGLIGVITFYYAEVIILVLYGDNWLSSVFYIKLLVVGSFFHVQEMFNRNIFKIFDRTDKILQLEIIKKIIQSVTLVYGILTMSISNLLIGYILTNIISFSINYYYAKKIQNHFVWNDLFILIKVIVIAITVVIACMFFTYYFNVEGFYTLMILPFLVLSYVSLLHIFNVSNIRCDFRDLQNMITKKKIK